LQEMIVAYPDGTPCIAERKLTSSGAIEPDWTDEASVALDVNSYRSEFRYDGMGRTIEQKLPDSTTRKFSFNTGGGIQKITVSTNDGVLHDMEILKNATYDAKGMRLSAMLGNDTELSYTYERETFRLKALRSRRAGSGARVYQQISYNYDPMGNLVHCVDEAQQPASVNPRAIDGLNVSSHCEFTYDALYQLTEAQGRVHQALMVNDYIDRGRESNVPSDWAKGTRHISLNNGASIERYTQRYDYDESGNIRTMRHLGVTRNWTRSIWTSGTSNRSMPLTDLGDISITNPESRFDECGNCIYLPHLRRIEWNYRSNISKVVVIDRTDQGRPNDEEYYQYGADGMRIRKVTQRVIDVTQSIIELTEKIYIDGCEVKRIMRGSTEILRHTTSKIIDGTNLIAMIHSWVVDTLNRETDNIAQKKIHYQLSNHIGSRSLEIAENGDVITYEEYFPYGGTAFIAGRSVRDINLKEYRYSGKERDDFSGLYYYGYRYYAHWIGSWISPDPIGPEDSENLYLFVQNNPINLVDPNGLQSTRIRTATGATRNVTPRSELTPAQLRLMRVQSEGARSTLTRQLGREYIRLFGPGELVWHEIQGRWVWDPRPRTLPRTPPSDAPAEGDEGAGSEGGGTEGTDGGATEERDGGTEGDDAGTDTGTATGTGTDTTGGPQADGEGAGVNNGDGGTGTEAHTGEEVNPGDGGTGTGTEGTGTGSGRTGTGRGGGGTGTGSTGTGTTGTTGTGSTGTGTGRRTGTTGGTGGSSGAAHPQGGPNGRDGGTVGGTGQGTEGRIGGNPDGGTGSPDGSLTGQGTEGSGGTETGTDTSGGSPDGVAPGQVPGQGNGGEGNDRNGTGTSGPTGGNGSDRGGGSGANPNGSDEEPSWWQRALLAMAGALYSIGNIFVEAGKQLYDMVGLGIQCFGIATGWFEYEHEVASGIGMAAQQGQGTLDIFRGMGRGIIETPRRALEAAERGDWFSFGAESMNLYMLGRGGYSLARGGASFAFNRSVGALGRFGTWGTSLRASIRTWQVQRIAAAVERRLNLSNQGLTWEYGGSTPRAYGSYRGSTRTITINESSFTPGLLSRLPRFGTPYSPFSRLGISRLLRGRSSMTTPMHEGWHAAQHLRQPGWFNNIPRLTNPSNYSVRPHEFTQPGSQPMMGAHNYAFRFALPSDFSLFFGLTGSANNNTSTRDQR
jgi:RHS repeat-associated protein